MGPPYSLRMPEVCFGEERLTGVLHVQYNASKAAVVQLAKCLSVEWVDYCRVNCISPGFIATEILDHHPKEWREKWYDMIPAKRMAQAYELKGVCCTSN